MARARARALFLLAGIIFWAVGAMAHFYHTKVLFWDVYPFQILTIPAIGIGAAIFAYGLVAGRKIKGGKK